MSHYCRAEHSLCEQQSPDLGDVGWVTCPDCLAVLRGVRLGARRRIIDAMAQGENPDFDDIRAALGLPDPKE